MLFVQENSSAVRAAQAIRSKKLIISSKGLRYTFEKIYQPLERLLLAVLKDSSSVQTPLAIPSKEFLICSSYPFKKETVSYFGSCFNARPDLKQFAVLFTV